MIVLGSSFSGRSGSINFVFSWARLFQAGPELKIVLFWACLLFSWACLFQAGPSRSRDYLFFLGLSFSGRSRDLIFSSLGLVFSGRSRTQNCFILGSSFSGGSRGFEHDYLRFVFFRQGFLYSRAFSRFWIVFTILEDRSCS